MEACRRTILTAHSASFQYADSILERWKNNQVRTLDDVTRLDAAFEKSRAARTKKTQENKSAKNTSIILIRERMTTAIWKWNLSKNSIPAAINKPIQKEALFPC